MLLYIERSGKLSKIEYTPTPATTVGDIKAIIAEKIQVSIESLELIVCEKAVNDEVVLPELPLIKESMGRTLTAGLSFDVAFARAFDRVVRMTEKDLPNQPAYVEHAPNPLKNSNHVPADGYPHPCAPT